MVAKTRNGMVLAARLLEESAAIVGLRESSDAHPFALMTSAGLLAGDGLPAIAIRRDYRSQHSDRERGHRLFISFSMQDVVLLRALGIPVAPSLGLSEANGDDLQQLLSSCEINDSQHASAAGIASQPAGNATVSSAPNPHQSDRPTLGQNRAEPFKMSGPDNQPDGLECGGARPELELEFGADNSLELVLVAWSPALLDLELPEGFTAVAARFLDLGRYRGIDIANIAAWRPTREELTRIRFCLDLGEVSAAADALRSSAIESLFALNIAPGKRGRVVIGAADYVQLVSQLEALVRADHDSFDPLALKEMRLRLDAVVECDLVGPLIEKAMATDDPLDRNLMITGGGLARWLHRQAPFIGAGFAQSTSAGARHDMNVAETDFATYLKAAAQFRAIYRDLKR